jgi:pentatricopeptide repeat domain-containing protein 1
MRRAKIPPTVGIYNSLLGIYRRSDETPQGGGRVEAHTAGHERVMRLYAEMRADGVAESDDTLVHIIASAEPHNRWEDAVMCFDHMVQSAAHPATSATNSLLRVCSQAAQWEVAMQVYEGMRAANVAPDVTTFSYLVSACDHAGEWTEALAVFQRMKDAGFVANIVTYSAIMEAAAQAGEAEVALALHREMKEAGVAPNMYALIYQSSFRGMYASGSVSNY